MVQEEQDSEERVPLEDENATGRNGNGRPELAAQVSRSRPHLGLTRAEMNWAAVAHGSVLLTVLLGVATGGPGALVGVAIPAAIWAVYRGKSEYVADQARQATMFQLLGMAALLALAIAGTLLLVVGWVVAALLTIVLVGLVLIPVMIVVTVLFVIALVSLPVAQVLYGCYGAAEASSGRPFRYKWVSEIMDRRTAQSRS
jgi:uncharacterized Tic20 family protein